MKIRVKAKARDPVHVSIIEIVPKIDKCASTIVDVVSEKLITHTSLA